MKAMQEIKAAGSVAAALELLDREAKLAVLWFVLDSVYRDDVAFDRAVPELASAVAGAQEDRSRAIAESSASSPPPARDSMPQLAQRPARVSAAEVRAGSLEDEKPLPEQWADTLIRMGYTREVSTAAVERALSDIAAQQKTPPTEAQAMKAALRCAARIKLERTHQATSMVERLNESDEPAKALRGKWGREQAEKLVREMIEKHGPLSIADYAERRHFGGTKPKNQAWAQLTAMEKRGVLKRLDDGRFALAEGAAA